MWHDKHILTEETINYCKIYYISDLEQTLNLLHGKYESMHDNDNELEIKSNHTYHQKPKGAQIR